MKVSYNFVFDYLIKEIKNEIGVYAIMGNIEAESNFNSKNLQNTFNTKYNISDADYTTKIDTNSITETEFIRDGSGYGLCQWTWWSRKEGLYDLAKRLNTSISDPSMQLDYLLIELKTKYIPLFAKLQNATDLYIATKDFMFDFENPYDKSEKQISKRFEYAKRIKEILSNTNKNSEKHYIQLGAYHNKKYCEDFINRYRTSIQSICGNAPTMKYSNSWYRPIVEINDTYENTIQCCKKLKQYGYDCLIYDEK